MKKEVLKEEVDQILNQSFWTKSGIPLNENTTLGNSTNDEAPVDSEVIKEQAHSCPLCESELIEEISDEKLMGHVDSITNIVNEMNDISDSELNNLIEETDTESSEIS